MSDVLIRALLPYIAAFITLFWVPLGLLWHFLVREALIVRWVAYRLRVARRVRRAAYIIWWREHGR